MQILIAAYEAGGDDSFAAMNIEDVLVEIKKRCGGHEVSLYTASNGTCSITWADDSDWQFSVVVVRGKLVGMDDKPRYLSRLAESFDIYVATRANAEYWAGEVNNGYEEGSHEHIVYAGEIKLCVDEYTGKVK